MSLLTGFPGSPDLLDQTSLLEAGNLNKPLGKLPGPPDVLKYCAPTGHNPSIIKHTTDPRIGQPPSLIQRQPQAGPPGSVMMVAGNNKVQRRFSHQSQVRLGTTPLNGLTLNISIIVGGTSFTEPAPASHHLQLQQGETSQRSDCHQLQASLCGGPAWAAAAGRDEEREGVRAVRESGKAEYCPAHARSESPAASSYSEQAPGPSHSL